MDSPFDKVRLRHVCEGDFITMNDSKIYQVIGGDNSKCTLRTSTGDRIEYDSKDLLGTAMSATFYSNEIEVTKTDMMCIFGDINTDGNILDFVQKQELGIKHC